MIDHVTIRVDELGECMEFHVLALELLGGEPFERDRLVDWIRGMQSCDTDTRGAALH